METEIKAFDGRLVTPMSMIIYGKKKHN